MFTHLGGDDLLGHYLAKAWRMRSEHAELSNSES